MVDLHVLPISWNDMITVYGIETNDCNKLVIGGCCWNDMITVYGIETPYP